jgi:hypothetical protein
MYAAILKTTTKRERYMRAHALVARERFELSSKGPKPSMLVHYTTGLSMGYDFLFFL